MITMANDRNKIPTISPLAVALLDLGKAIHDNHGNHIVFRPTGSDYPPLPDPATVISLLKTRKEAGRLISFRDGEPDVIEIRTLAVTTWLGLMSDHNPCVRWISDLVGGEDPQAILLTRAAIRRLCERRVLRFRDGETKPWNGTVTITTTATSFLGLTESGGCLFNERTLTKLGVKPQEGNGTSGTNAVTEGCIPGPQALFEEIRRHVIGMDPIVRTFVARLRLHLIRMEQLKANSTTVSTPNEVLLFCGPSGSGKTWLAETGSRLSGLPFGSSDLSGVSEDGYCGQSVADVIRPVIQSAGGDVGKARYGIIFLDELDSKRQSKGVDRDVSGANVQKALLKLIEGCQYQVGGRRGGLDAPLQFDSRGAMFIFAGAFVGSDEILARQTRRHSSIGFAGSPSEGTGAIGKDLHAALEQFGILPEFLNRLTGVFKLPCPTIDQLISIARAPTGVIASYGRLLNPGGLDITVTDEAVRLMAEHAHSHRTYARGLKGVMSRLGEDAVFSQGKGRIVYGVTEVRAALAGMGDGG